jgi:hypothetical protein
LAGDERELATSISRRDFQTISVLLNRMSMGRTRSRLIVAPTCCAPCRGCARASSLFALASAASAHADLFEWPVLAQEASTAKGREQPLSTQAV